MLINQKFIIFIFCFSIFSSISQTNEDVPLNNIAINEIPRPILPVIFEDFSGNKINLKNYLGKLVIINFWATWCAPCKKEMPMLQTMHLNKEEYGIQIIGIAVDHNEPVRDFINEYGIEFPILIGQSKAYEIMQQLGNTATTLPYTVVVEPDGLISWYKNTELKPDDLPSILGY